MLGVPEDKVEWLQKSGVKLSLISSALIFQVPDMDHSGVVEVCDVKLGLMELAMLNKGNLTPAKVAILRKQIIDVINYLDGTYAGYLANLPPAPEQPAGTLGKLPPLKTPLTFVEAMKQHGGDESGTVTGSFKSAIGSLQTLPKSTGGWPVFDMDKIKTADLVKLRDATHMYQPVHGSSEGSRYFVVGANSDVRIAARLKKGQLSVRIEGPNWSQYKNEIQSVGFSKLSKSEQYASVHFMVGDDVGLANKTLGAVLTGLGIALETPIPNIALTVK
jgi:hypothetical protein